MSIENFKKYGQKVAEDKEVRAKAKEIGINHIDGQIAYAKTLGLEFTVKDMEELAREAGISVDELSEEDLEKVAGGFFVGPATLVPTVAPVITVIAPAISIPTIPSSMTTASRNW